MHRLLPSRHAHPHPRSPGVTRSCPEGHRDSRIRSPSDPPSQRRKRGPARVDMGGKEDAGTGTRRQGRCLFLEGLTSRALFLVCRGVNQPSPGAVFSLSGGEVLMLRLRHFRVFSVSGICPGWSVSKRAGGWGGWRELTGSSSARLRSDFMLLESEPGEGDPRYVLTHWITGKEDEVRGSLLHYFHHSAQSTGRARDALIFCSRVARRRSPATPQTTSLKSRSLNASSFCCTVDRV